MAIANKLEIIYDSCKDIRDVITEKNSSLGKGSITTLGSDVTKICNPNNYIHKVNINPQEIQRLDNENITIENYGNAGNTKTRGAIYIPLAGAYNWTATFTINDGSILQYGCGITAAVPTTGVDVISITYTGWKTTGSGTTSYSTAANCNYLYLMATYIDGATGIPTFEEFVSNATFSLTAYGKNGSVREDDYVGPNYTSIAYGKYQNDLNLSNVIIPDTVTTIGRYGFQNCSNLHYINLENIKTLNGAAFTGCDLYCDINMPNLQVNSNYDGYNFRYNKNIKRVLNLGKITKFAGDPVTSSGEFLGCSSLESVVLPETLTNLGNCTFCNCTKLKTINFPGSITTIGCWVFRNCHELTIENLYLPNLVSIKADSFYGQGIANSSFPYIKNITSLGSITSLPAGDAAAGYGTFSSFTGLLSVNLHEGLVSIGTNTFCNCRSLPNITLPSTLTSIRRWAFRYCTALEYIVCLSTTPPTLYDGQVFQYDTLFTKIYVPYSEDHSILDAYKAATNWSAHASKMIELNPDGSIPA